MEKKDASSEEIEKLENSLIKNWRELDRMMYCTKLPMCVKHYLKKFRVENKEMKANVVQSMSITLNQIKNIRDKIRDINR